MNRKVPRRKSAMRSVCSPCGFKIRSRISRNSSSSAAARPAAGAAKSITDKRKVHKPTVRIATAAGCSCGSSPMTGTSAAGFRLLDESFRLHRFLNLGTRGDAVDIGFQARPLGEVHFDAARPPQNGEKVRVGHGELVAHQVLAPGELLVEPVETFTQVFL